MQSRFLDFWAAWPPNAGNYSRKGCKGECNRIWIQRGLDAQADHIIAHVLWLRTTDQWLRDDGRFIPAPLVYLHQSRWDGAEIPESPAAAAARREAAYQRDLRASIAARSKA